VTTIRSDDWNDSSLEVHVPNEQDLRLSTPEAETLPAAPSLQAPTVSPPLAQRLVNQFVAALAIVLGTFLCAEIAANGWQIADLNSNPHVGPSIETLILMGAKVTPKMQRDNEWYRLASSPLLSAGVIHFLGNLLLLLVCSRHLVQQPCVWMIPVIFFASAAGGTLISNSFEPFAVTVASSAGMAGLLGATWLDVLIHSWEPVTCELCMLCVATASLFSIGIMPFVGNFAHIGGMFIGAMLWLSAASGHRSRFEQGDMAARLRCLQVVGLGLVLAVLVTNALLPLFEPYSYGWQCSWCRRLSCVPTSLWSCVDVPLLAEVDGTYNITTCGTAKC